MPAYCFFDVLEVVDPEKLERYRDGVLYTVEHYGGRYLTVGGQCDVVEGDWRPVFPVLIEFPSLEQAHRWYDSEEYRELKALRLAATRGNTRCESLTTTSARVEYRNFHTSPEA